MKGIAVFRCALALLWLAFATASARAVQFFDDFSTGFSSWYPGPTFNVTNPVSGVYFLQSNCPTNDQAWRLYLPLGSSWQIQSDITFQSYYGGTGVGLLALAQSNLFTTLLADVKQMSSGYVQIVLSYNTTNWITVLQTGFAPSACSAYHITLTRPGSGNLLQISVRGTNGISYSATTTAIPENVLDSLSTVGYRANSAVVDFANLQVTTPSPNPTLHYLSQATNAVNDMISNFWVGSAQTGQIINTHGGLTNSLLDPRGVLWERGDFYFVLNNLWLLTGDATLQQRLQADWSRTKSVFTTSQLSSCGTGSPNVASDDSGWTSLMYLNAYQATGDQTALVCAEGLVTNAFNRWYDGQLGGGLWYNDSEQQKSLYSTAVTLAALRIYELTGNQAFYNLCMESYNWMETYLLRSDNLYWCEYTSSGPSGADNPDKIGETGSTVFIGGIMGMAVLHAHLYHLTGDTNYLYRAVRTVNAVFNSPLTTQPGVYLDDRDAQTDGIFSGDWAREVLTLPGIDPKHWCMLWTTADSIYSNDRTTNGYYGGSWSGPADGPGSVWWAQGTIPQEITVSSSAVDMIAAAAVLEGQYTNVIAPRAQIALQSPRTISVTNFGQPLWPYQLESSPDLVTWTAKTNFYADPVLFSFNWTAPMTGSQLFFRAMPLVQP